MGMATQQNDGPLFPISAREIKAGLVQCTECEAIVNPKTEWQRGFRSPKGATHTNKFHAVSNVPIGKCPICLTVLPMATDRVGE